MTESTHAKIPHHLRKYIVDQNYGRYTPEDQAVWRYIMRQLKNFLSTHAHSSYLDGLKKTGLRVDRIPSIDEIDEHLERFGWGAVPVSGFIPPAAFMEFQAIGVLPIASDMRTLNHLQYTPAPDIVHEAAGHAPILADPEYAAYLRLYGDVARHTIISKDDLAQYEAIRVLSDIKEDPRSTKEQIAEAEKNLERINRGMKHVSEAALLSRMNWWTAEYGLIGNPKDPKIFGAGLLSSVGEARTCLNPKVQKIPLSIDCVNFSYDITEPQPQLFVTESFAHLGDVLDQLADRLSYRRGGLFGLERAVEAETVNTVQLNSGVLISGLLSKFLSDGASASYLQFSGPCQLGYGKAEIQGQGVSRHPHGFSSPLGRLKNHSRCLSTYTRSDLGNLGLHQNRRSRLEFESGVVVEGMLSSWLYRDNKLVLMTWQDARVTLGEQLLFDPSWGDYDMAVGSEVASVFGGPADRTRYGQTEDFVAKRVPGKSRTPEQEARHRFYQRARDLREGGNGNAAAVFRELDQEYRRDAGADWLQGVELLELTYLLELESAQSAREGLLAKLKSERRASADIQRCIQDGIELAPVDP
jgi:phenylalanine-4-hydroxylase